MTRKEAKNMIYFNSGINFTGKVVQYEFANKAIDKIYDEIEHKVCKNCKFWKDYRKCPMADHENVLENGYCYNWYQK